MVKTLYTTGYEGIDIDTFIENLKDNNIKCVLDVREIPLSRKRGFSKTTLNQRLSEENIKYVHFKELGSPKPIRDRLKTTKDYATFFKKMDVYLKDKKDIIETAFNYATKRISCLMCFEHLAATCHRRVVASKLKEFSGNKLNIENI